MIDKKKNGSNNNTIGTLLFIHESEEKKKIVELKTTWLRMYGAVFECMLRS